MSSEIDPQHSAKRSVLRTVGPLVMAVGGLFLAVGMISFFSSFGSFSSGPPRYFWCAFVGMPILFVGLVLTKFGYMGSVARYMSGEMAPVGKDTFNYVAKGTQEGVEAVAGAIGRGLASGQGADLGQTEVAVRCHKCNEENDADAKFCNECGAALAKTKACPECKELNDPDARFCDNCGRALE